MNTNYLANLLYPNITKTPEDYNTIYPPRQLAPGQEVTRIAPSPTGFMHFGNFFSAFLNWQISRSANGVFFFRLEDTDKKREIKGSELIALKTLNDYGLIPDEGLTVTGQEKGAYGPYTQSQRTEIYHTFAKDLVKRGKAFPCFCQKTENIQQIKQQRQQALETDNQIQDKDACRNLTLQQIEQFLSQGKKFALRLKSQGQAGEKIQAHDIIRGTRTLAKNCKDVVLVKSDGIPPYAFAHAVDDYLMKTTTVVRGEEWYVSYPAHIEIFEALGFKLPKYLHTPVIMKIDEQTGNKRKLSKRKDPVADMRYFSKQGYPKQAILEYLLTLANSNYEIWRLQNPDKHFLDFEFTTQKISASNPLFDFMKLNDISKNYISKLTATQVYDNLVTFTQQYDQEFYEKLAANKTYALNVLEIDRGGNKPRKDFATWQDFKQVFGFMFGFKQLNQKQDFQLENINPNKVLAVVSAYKNIYNSQEDKNEWFNKIKQLGASLGYATDNKAYKQAPQDYQGNIADVCTYIRLALTGSQSGPDLYSVSKVLGTSQVKNRLEKLETILS